MTVSVVLEQVSKVYTCGLLGAEGGPQAVSPETRCKSVWWLLEPEGAPYILATMIQVTDAPYRAVPNRTSPHGTGHYMSSRWGEVYGGQGHTAKQAVVLAWPLRLVLTMHKGTQARGSDPTPPRLPSRMTYHTPCTALSGSGSASVPRLGLEWVAR